MATGYRVNLGGDKTLWAGDSLSTTPTSFTPSAGEGRIGAGSITVTGVVDDQTLGGMAIGGTYYEATDGQVYFVPDAETVTLVSAAVQAAPVYTVYDMRSGDGASNVILGTNAPQNSDGGGGNDTVLGASHFDSTNPTQANALGGETDTDVLRGGTGHDELLGQGGWDRLIGNSGDDRLYGGNGTDIADMSDGSAGIGLVIGNGYQDLRAAGLGVDLWDGIDGAIGTAFNDTLLGYDGDGMDPDGSAWTNYIDGNGGHDVIDGRSGSDFLFGGTGNDTIVGGVSDGDAGVILQAGRASHTGGAIDDQIFGGAGHDRIYGDDMGGLGAGGNDYIDAGAGDDGVVAGLGDDTVLGGAGNDTIFGDEIVGTDPAGGDDLLLGGAGDDRIIAGAGNDVVDGGTGNDRLFAGAGNDTVLGGAGNDTLDGGGGTDRLTGGDGFDVFVAQDRLTITDFNTTTGGDIRDGDQANNDFIDLSDYYNDTTLAIWNTEHPDQQYDTPLQWMRADYRADGDGVLDQAGPNITILNGGAPLAEDKALGWDNTNVICFGAEARILTPRGPVAAGDLAVGDRVETRDGGAQAIRWIGRRHLGAAALAAHPHLRPVRIRAGALGAGLPHADLVVSPQHRMLVRSAIARRMFGVPEVLVAACQLCQIAGIDRADDLDAVTYVHFLCDDHQIVFANGAESESLLAGPQALAAVGPAARAEILALFPALGDGAQPPLPAAALANGRMGRRLAARHAQNSRALVC